MFQGKTRGPRRSVKHGVREAGERDQEESTTASPWWRCSPAASVSFAAFCFPMQFFSLCCDFCL